MPNTQTDTPEISVSLVTELVAEQFPQWSHLPIKPVEPNGHDNRTFRLGSNMSVRLPSAEGYAAQVLKEQTWLSRLVPCLPCPISQPLAMGSPSKDYPWNWSVYRWIEGKSANTLTLDDAQLQRVAVQLAQFLVELHKVDAKGAPPPGLHNYYRGEHPQVYDAEARSNIAKLEGLVNPDHALAVWEKALRSRWDKNPVWVHGDVASGNILIQDDKLGAVIDFGCMGAGDPACDLVIAWTFFKAESRAIFKEHIGLDPDTWARARGWALWKACFELVAFEDKASPEALQRRGVIEEIIGEALCQKPN